MLTAPSEHGSGCKELGAVRQTYAYFAMSADYGCSVRRYLGEMMVRLGLSRVWGRCGVAGPGRSGDHLAKFPLRLEVKGPDHGGPGTEG